MTVARKHTMRGGKAAAAVEERTAAIEERAAAALRRAGGALPVERLYDSLDGDAAGHLPLARALRSRRDLFLLMERPSAPWGDDDWPGDERSEYERLLPRPGERVVLLDGTAAEGTAPPALLRETLLSLWDENPEDAQVRRELGRAVFSGE